MEIINRFWEWYDDFRESCEDKSKVIAFAFGALLVFAGIFVLLLNVLSPFQLTGFIRYSIISIIDLIIFVPIYLSILSPIYVFNIFIKEMNEITSDSNQSLWYLFFSFIRDFIRDNAFILGIVLIYIFFYRFWETWIGNHIIDPFLCHFESNIHNDILFIIATIICLVLIYVKIVYIVIKKDIVIKTSQRTLLLSIIALVMWAYYRFHGLCGMNDSAYYMGFTPLSIFNPIKYFDIVFVIAIYEFTSYFFWKTQDTYLFNLYRVDYRHTDGLTRDTPISGIINDSLHRGIFAKSMVDELWRTDTSCSSFTCGIDAPWGSGKTSFINLMKYYLEYEEYQDRDKYVDDNKYKYKSMYKYHYKIIIDFNPWMYAAGKDLVTAFFDELSKELKQYDRSLAKNLIDYSKLLSAFDTTETKLISSLLDLIQHDDSSLKEKKKQISEAIKRINRRIFVFIDDLDRLEVNEILEMMKMIRNVSDFPYMYIIAAYDKSYLTKCLSTKLKSGTTNFIEKIFEHEHILTPCSNESLRRALVDELKIYSLECEDFIMDHNNRILDALSNLRELHRLSNNFASTKSFLMDRDFHDVDVLLIGFFKTKYPVAFSLFEHKWNEVLVPVEQGKYQYYELFQGENKEGYFNFIKYLENHQEEMSLNEFDIKTIRLILSELFKFHENEKDDEYRINNVRWFSRYLNLTQLESDITEKEFNAVMNKPIDEIKRAIDDWLVNKSVSLEYRLVNYRNKKQLNRDQLVKSIQALFYVSIRKDWMIFYEINNVISLLKWFNDDHTFSEEDRTFILSQLKDNGYSHFMIDYVGYLFEYKKYSDISLNETDLIDIQQNMFNNSCKQASAFISIGNDRLTSEYVLKVLVDFCGLLGRSFISFSFFGYDRNDLFEFDITIKPNGDYVKRLVGSMRNFAKDHIEVFLQIIIYYDDAWKKGFRIYEITKSIWGSWNQFSEYLSTLDESNPIFAEFKAFYTEFEKNNYQPVQFDFKSIKVK